MIYRNMSLIKEIEKLYLISLILFNVQIIFHYFLKLKYQIKMIFCKQYLIKLTFTVIGVLVMPAASMNKSQQIELIS